MPADVLEDISRGTTAPFFGIIDTHIGRGLLGGHCVDLFQLGSEAAQLVGRAAAKSTTTPPLKTHQTRVMFDARLLDRFGIDRDALPPGSTVLFDEPGLFERHRVSVIGAIAALMIQGLLITALLIQLKRRRTAEARVRDSEVQLLLQVAEAPIPIVYTVRGGNKLAINRAFTRLYGWSTEDLPNENAWFRRVYPDDAYRAEVLERWLASVDAARRTNGRIEPMTYRLTCKDGSEREVEIAASIVGGTSFGTFTDVTERNRAVANSRQRETELREILESLPFPVAVTRIGPDILWTDPAAQVLFLNRKHREAFGYSLEDIPTIADWARAAYPDDVTLRNEILAGWDRKIQRVIHTGGTLPFHESVITTKDGSRRDVVISAVAVGDRLVTSFLDVTERNRMLRELRASEEHFRTIVAKAPVAIGYESELGNYINEMFTRLFGYAQEEVPDFESWLAIAYPDEAYRAEVVEQWQRHYRDALETGSRVVRADEYRIRCKDNSTREIEISGIIAADRVYVVFVDMTERNRIQREMRELRDRMAHVSRVSTLGELAGSLAHELNQPLGAILRNVETAEQLLAHGTPDTATLRDIVTDIRQDNARAGAVIDRIRALVKQQPLRIGEVHMAGIIRNVVAIVRQSVEHSRIAIGIECADDLPSVRGDRLQLQQVLLNLLVNSIEAIGERGDGRIEIRVAGEGAWLRVSVRDNGGGTDPALMHELFNAFHTTKADGLGMGLAIARSIIEDHGGRIAAAHENDGLEIAFTIPVWQGVGST